jgi:hypothetical protein
VAVQIELRLRMLAQPIDAGSYLLLRFVPVSRLTGSSLWRATGANITCTPQKLMGINHAITASVAT